MVSAGSLLLVVAACECGAAVDRSDGVVPELEAPHFDGRTIALDGRLDEQPWRRAGRTGPFVAPGTGRAQPDSPVAARARLGWDDAHLYVGAVIEDEAPRSPFDPQDEDPHIWTRASALELMIQPGDPGHNRHYYEVQVDVSGAVWDTHFDDYNDPITRGPGGAKRFGHPRWTSEVRRGVQVDSAEGHYTVELALPWRAFTNPHGAVPPEPGDGWRMNLYSFRDGQRQAMAWSPLLGEGNFHRASRFGRVRFVVLR